MWLRPKGPSSPGLLAAQKLSIGKHLLLVVAPGMSRLPSLVFWALQRCAFLATSKAHSAPTCLIPFPPCFCSAPQHLLAQGLQVAQCADALGGLGCWRPSLMDTGTRVLSPRVGVRHGQRATPSSSELGPCQSAESTGAVAEGGRWEGLGPSAAGTGLKIGFLASLRSLMATHPPT